MVETTGRRAEAFILYEDIYPTGYSSHPIHSFIHSNICHSSSTYHSPIHSSSIHLSIYHPLSIHPPSTLPSIYPSIYEPAFFFFVAVFFQAKLKFNEKTFDFKNDHFCFNCSWVGNFQTCMKEIVKTTERALIMWSDPSHFKSTFVRLFCSSNYLYYNPMTRVMIMPSLWKPWKHPTSDLRSNNRYKKNKTKNFVVVEQP